MVIFSCEVNVEYSSVLFLQLIKMIVFMAIGLALVKLSILKEEDSSVLAKLLLNVIIPLTIVNSFITNRFTASELASSLFLAFLSLAISVSISVVAFRKDLIAAFGSSFANVGFIGIPLVSAVVGSKYVMYISGLVAMTNMLQWIYGVLFFSGKKNSKCNIKDILLNPMVLSFVIGVLLNPISSKFPALVSDCTSSIAACNAPVAMLLLGMYLGKIKFAEIFSDGKAYIVCLVRLIIIPIVSVLLFAVMPIGNITMKLALLISAVTPVGPNIAVYAQKYGMDYKFSVVVTCLSTIFSTISVPLMVSLALMIWN